MANWHGYIGVEDLALTAPQRAAIVAAFRTLGPGSDPQPAHLNHWRVSNDASKVIFEALFNEASLTVENVKQFLADATGADPANISDALTQTAYGPMATYTVAAIDRIRLVLFGGIGADWQDSRAACTAYIFANLGEWT